MRSLLLTPLMLSLAGTALPAQQRPLATIQEVPRVVAGPDLGQGLVLGRTLLLSARRMFPDAPRLVDGRSFYSLNDGNPQPIDRSPVVWDVAGGKLEPKYLFQLGPDAWTLYFDTNQRLIGAVKSQMPAMTSSADFAKAYPSHRQSFEGRDYVSYEAMVQPCQVATASFSKADNHLLSFAWNFTCATSPAGQ